MPELPEVETIARQLRVVLVGKKLVEVEVRRERSFVGEVDEARGKKIDEVGRKGKVLWIGFEGNGGLMIHLKMTGQLVWRKESKKIVGGHPTVDWVEELPSKHTRVVLSLDDGARLFFNDLRVFGWIKMVTDEDWEKQKSKLPADVVDDGFGLEKLMTMVGKTKKAIKLLVMDSSKIGGVGNIYANDALWLAKIRPSRPANTLTKKEVKVLYESVREVIDKGIRLGGASARNYVDVSGLGGSYQDHFLTYQQQGKPCTRCGENIVKEKLGGRGTFWCPGCQK